MPDLIIKPAAQSGNKVIIQDQAGGAVITTADSGATLADGIALGTPTSGTLTSCTGLPLTGLSASGTKNSGTFLRGDNTWDAAGSTSASDLTSGTLPAARLTSTTFPAGHVVKVTKVNMGTFSESCVHANASKSNYNQLGSTTWDVVLKQANSKILIIGNFTMGGYGSHGYFDMKRGGTSGSWLGGEDGMFANHKNQTDNKDSIAIHWLDSPGTNAATTTITYVPYVGQWSGTETVEINGYSSSNPQQIFYTHFTFLEIAV